MRGLIQAAAELLREYLPLNLKPLIEVVVNLVNDLDLPDDSPRWNEVAEYAADVLRDIREARDLTHDKRLQVRLAAEHRFHDKLRGAGLIGRG